MRIVSIKIPENLLEELDSYAYRNNMSRSDVIRLAIKTYLANNNTPKPKIKIRRVALF
ncbi:MAG: hypothetical protein B7O98_04105 [Zestosphaera tikiterensis]|uniref:Ribbon-helix-helix protein CopG domain-containing protein n=1 Tax=Zestosphaera tikiterensis TaxID=1973259 RepID=A0A2R7Y883_9CREN|nr:MAG: hypothetical protein B7O98_04105 [Zestosphaera tikiterensis]